MCVCNLFTWIGSKASKCISQCGIGTEESMSHWASCLPDTQNLPVRRYAWMSARIAFPCVCVCLCWFYGFFPCLCKQCKPYGLGWINVANFNTILRMCLTEREALPQHTQAPAWTKALVAFYTIIHQVFDMNLLLSSHSVRKKKNNNWAHYLSSLWHIRFIIFLQRLPVWVL